MWAGILIGMGIITLQIGNMRLNDRTSVTIGFRNVGFILLILGITMGIATWGTEVP